MILVSRYFTKTWCTWLKFHENPTKHFALAKLAQHVLFIIFEGANYLYLISFAYLDKVLPNIVDIFLEKKGGHFATKKSNGRNLERFRALLEKLQHENE